MHKIDVRNDTGLRLKQKAACDSTANLDRTVLLVALGSGTLPSRQKINTRRGTGFRKARTVLAIGSYLSSTNLGSFEAIQYWQHSEKNK